MTVKPKHKVVSLISLILVFTMFFEITLGGFASVVQAEEETNQNTKSMSQDLSKKDDVIEKGADYTIFENEDGSRTMESYLSDVRIKQEDGSYVDIDNSIKPIPQTRNRNAKHYAYKNKKGLADIKFPENLSDSTPVSVKANDDEVTFKPIFEGNPSAAETKGTLKKKTVTDLYEGREEQNHSIVYGTDNSDVKIEYIPLDAGVKENIILNEIPDSNEFKYEITCDGMTPQLESGGGIIFKDKETKEEKGAIMAPYMIDSSETDTQGYSEDLEYSIEPKAGVSDTYIITLTVSEDYLNDEDRVYPVTIDPTYTANTSTGVKDVYIESGYPTSNFYQSGIRKMAIGYGSKDKICRTLLKFPELQAKISKNHVTSASLKLYENYNGSPYATVGLYRNTETWALGEVTWNKRPNYNTTAYTTVKLTGGTASHSWSMTKICQEWARGTYKNYGILLRATTESSSTLNYGSFYGSRTTDASRRPVLTVNFTVPTPKPPSTASSVTATLGSTTATTVYAKEGSAIAVKWAGINSNVMEAIQRRIIRYGADNVFENATETSAYKSLGTTASSGTNNFTILKANGWSEGRYGIGIRGVDKGNNKGSGKYCFVYVDNTAPTAVSNMSLTSSRTSAAVETAKVKVSFKINADKPAVNPSGIKQHTIKLYNSAGTLLGTNTSTVTTVGNTVTSEFSNIASGATVYAKITTADKSGNSVTATSPNHKISNLVLPDASGENGCVSNLAVNKWVDENQEMKVSWDIVYEGNLNKITYRVLDSNKAAVANYNETNISLPSGTTVYPKKQSDYLIAGLNNLESGKYFVRMRFYATDGVGYEQIDLPYWKDAVKPSAAITSPANNSTMKQIVEIAYDASDAHSGLQSKKLEIINPKGNSKILTESEDIYHFDTSGYDDGEYTLKLTVTDNVGHVETNSITTHITNPPPTPTFDLVNYYGAGSGELPITWQWVQGDNTIAKVDHLEYVFDNKDGTWTVIADSNPNTEDTTKYQQKEGTINYTDLTAGNHTLYIRAVDSDGVPGTIRNQKYIVDTQAPQISLTSPTQNKKFIDLVYVKGSIEDTYLDSYEIYVASGSDPADGDFNKVKKIENPKERTTISGTLAVVNLSDNTAYPADNIYTIRVKAKDKCGNESTPVNVAVEKKNVIKSEADFKVAKTDIPVYSSDPNAQTTESVVLVGGEEQSFNLKQLDDSAYNLTSGTWFVDGEKLVPNEAGKFDFSDSTKYGDDSIHSIVVRDEINNSTQYSTPTYEYNVYDSIAEDKINAIDTTTENNTIKLSTGKTEGSYEILAGAESMLPPETLELMLTADENIPEGTTAEYFIKLNDGTYQKIDANTYYPLGNEDSILNSLKVNSIAVKVVLTASSTAAPEISSLNIKLKGSTSDVLKVDMMNQYNPKNVQVQSGLNYRTRISWDKVEGADTEGVTYEVYRCEGNEFNDTKAECVQAGISDDFWYDSYTPIDQYSNANNNEGPMTRSSIIKDYKKDFTYKVKAVKDFGSQVRRSNGTKGSQSSQLPSLDEYIKRLGIKDYWGYYDFETPTGEGYVEQSKGNLVYQQTDAEVKGKEFDLEMERTYNSLSTNTTPIGIGWDFAFNSVLMNTYNEYDDEVGMVFKDGTGTIYNFLKINHASAIQKELDEGTNRVKTRTEHYKSPFGVYIHLKKVETLDFEDKNADGKYDEVLDTKYIIETTDGMTYEFDRNSHITSIQDKNDNIVVFRYFDGTESNVTRGMWGLIKEVETLNGKTIEEFNAELEALESKTAEEKAEFNKKRSIIKFEYNDKNLISKVNLPNGNWTEYSYIEKTFNLGKKRNVLDKVSLYHKEGTEVIHDLDYDYGYGNGSNLTQILDPEGNVYEISYYDNGDIQNLKADASSEEQKHLDSLLDACKEIKDPNGDYREYQFTPSNNSTGTVQDFTQTTESTYVKQSIGDTVANFFSGGATPLAQDSVKYNQDGNVTWHKDSEGIVTESEYAFGLNTKNTTSLKSYNLDNSGVITKKSETVTDTTNYDTIPDNNTLAGKIGDTKGDVLSETDEEGNKITYTYDSNSNPKTKVTRNNEGTVIERESYEYDAAGNLTKTTNVLTGEVEITEYNENGEAISETEEIKGTTVSSTAYTYDEKGEVETMAEGKTEPSTTTKNKSVYDDYGREIIQIDTKGYANFFEYDPLDRIIKTSYNQTATTSGTPALDSNAYTEEKSYNKNGSLVYEKDKLGVVTRYEYDSMNRVIKTTVHENDTQTKEWETTYDYVDTTVYLPSGTVTYTDAYKVTEIIPGGDIISTKYYDRSNRIIKEVSYGIVTAYGYNEQGDAIETWTIGEADEADISKGKMVLATFDKNGKKTTDIINPIWDSEANTYKVHETDTIVNKYEYNSLEDVTKEVDGKGNVSTFAYDADGQITKAVIPKCEGESSANTTTYTYNLVDEDGNVVTKTVNAEGQITEKAEDEQGNEVRITAHGKNAADTAKDELRYEYNSDGKMTKSISGSGSDKKVIEYEYDAMSNLEYTVYKRDGEGKKEEYIHHQYDRNDKLISAKKYNLANQQGETPAAEYISLYTYDALERLTSVYEGTKENPTEAERTYFEYDNDDNITNIKYPTESTIYDVSYAYDNNKRLSDIKVRLKGADSSEGAATSPKLLREYEYTNDGKILNVKDYPAFNEASESDNYTLKTFAYDKVDRPIKITYKEADEVKEEYVYTYDKNNNLLSEEITNNYPSTDNVFHVKKEYTYDNLDRLTSEKETDLLAEENNITTTSYTYDKIGNRKTSTKDGIITHYVYDGDGLNRLMYTYEGNTDNNKVAYTYDSSGNVIKEVNGKENKTTDYVYDEESQVIKATTKLSVSETQSEVTISQNKYNADGSRIYKKVIKKDITTDSEGNTSEDILSEDVTNYYYADGDLLFTTNASGNITSDNIYSTDGDIIVSKRSNNKFYNYHLDSRDTTMTIVDSSKAFTTAYHYDAFGEFTKTGSADFYNEITYTGAVFDESTGLYYMNARYYDPETGRFITEDSERGELNDPLTQHLYAYCQNNPTNKVDPSGNISFRAICTIGGAVIGGAVGAYRSYKKTGKVRLRSVAVGAAVGAAIGFGGAKYGRRIYKAVKKSKTVRRVARKIKSKAKPIAKKARSAYKKVKCKVTKRSCFIAGTLVETAYGYKPIENVIEGELVYSENPETGEKELKEVLETYENEIDELVHILVSGEEIVTTPTHPFYTPDKGWRDAVKLKAGDKLVLRNGKVVVINEVSHEILEQPIKVYNFNVKDFHTYYVSDNSVLVHNDCGGKITKKIAKKKGRIGKQERLRQLSNDPKVSKTIRGELKNIKKQKGRFRVPKGHQLAHNKGYEAYKGYGYKHTRLQLTKNHRIEHKFYKPWLKRASKIFRRR